MCGVKEKKMAYTAKDPCLEVEQGRGILCVHPVQPKACRTWFKLYYFNPTMASINDTYIVLATIPSPAGLTQIPQ